MKKIFSLIAGLTAIIAVGQAGSPAAPYYNNFGWNQTGTALKDALATKIDITHDRNLNYGDLWTALKSTDQDPNNSQNVLVLYGSTDNTRSLAKSETCGNGNSSTGCGFVRWNREHTFVQSLGNPDLGQIGPGADAHHMRACTYTMNENRGNRKFAAGSGNAGNSGANWYPGDEWKGDVARMIMYMYLRYGNRCLPTTIGTGATVTTDTNMLQLFLQWNADDPVSQYEDNRNTYLGNLSNTYGQGNRNPFIDNPYLAYLIWGGPQPQNRWPSMFLSTATYDLAQVSVYPNPTNNHRINIESEMPIDQIELINVNGQIIQKIAKPTPSDNNYPVENIPKGFYFLRISSGNQHTTKKVIVN